MATLEILGSGSSGNGYVIHCSKETLLLEAGVPFNDVLSAIGHDVSSASACIASHAHSDHLGRANEVRRYQIPLYEGDSLQSKKRFRVGGFLILPLDVPHGSCPNKAYVIDHEEIGRLVFCTDAETFPYKIPRVNTLMIECNYSNNIRYDTLLDGDDVRSNSEAHMELETSVEVTKRHYTEDLRNVVLIHLSSKLSDERAFKQRFEREFPMIEVSVAKSGLRVDINKEPF